MGSRIRALVLGTLFSSVCAASIYYAAGSTPYWQGWMVLGAFAIGGILVLSVLLRDRELLARRMNLKERERGHMLLQFALMGELLFSMVFPALDHRFGWSHVPDILCIAGALLIVAAFVVQFIVLRENRFASATIEIASDQRVISSGIYAHIRHPWYLNLVLLFIGMPLALGSYWGLLILVPVVAMLAWRMRSEEGFLQINLPGYTDYMGNVRWRLVPGVY